MSDQELQELRKTVETLSGIIDNQSAHILALEAIMITMGRTVKRRFQVSEAVVKNLISRGTGEDPAGKKIQQVATDIALKLIASSAL